MILRLFLSGLVSLVCVGDLSCNLFCLFAVWWIILCLGLFLALSLFSLICSVFVVIICFDLFFVVSTAALELCVMQVSVLCSQIAKFMGPTWGPPGSCRPQMGPMLAPWTLLSGLFWRYCNYPRFNEVERGYTGFTLSVRPSVRGQKHARSVSSTTLARSMSYLHRASYQANPEGVSHVKGFFVWLFFLFF